MVGGGVEIFEEGVVGGCEFCYVDELYDGVPYVELCVLILCVEFVLVVVDDVVECVVELVLYFFWYVGFGEVLMGYDGV